MLFRRLIHLNTLGFKSGQAVQSLNSAAVTWSLAKQLYGPDGPYFWIPMSLLLGMAPTTIQWLIWKVCTLDISDPCFLKQISLVTQRWPVIWSIKVDTIILPIIYMVSAI